MTSKSKVKKSAEPTLAENYEQLKNLVIEGEADAIKCSEKSNNAAGARLRKTLKESKDLIALLRKQSIEITKK